MTTAPSPDPAVRDQLSDHATASIDEALREAVETIDSRAYQAGNPAFNPLTSRDVLLIGAVYVVLPVAIAILVWLS